MAFWEFYEVALKWFVSSIQISVVDQHVVANCKKDILLFVFKKINENTNAVSI